MDFIHSKNDSSVIIGCFSLVLGIFYFLMGIGLVPFLWPAQPLLLLSGPQLK